MEYRVPAVFSGVCVDRSLILCVMFLRSLFVPQSSFFWPFRCLSLLHLKRLITTLLSSHLSLKINLFSTWYSWKIAELASLTHSLTHWLTDWLTHSLTHTHLSLDGMILVLVETLATFFSVHWHLKRHPTHIFFQSDQ